MKYNSSQIQKKYGINRSTVGRWIKAKKLPVDEDSYFEESDFLVLFRKSRAWAERRQKLEAEKAAQSTAPLPLDERNQLTGDVLEPSDRGYTPPQGSAAVNDLSKVDLTNLKLQEEIRDKRRKNDLADGKLIKRDLVRKFFGRLGEIDSTEWRSYSARVVDDLCAICKVTDPAILVKLTRRLDDEVFAILASGQRAQHEFLISLPKEVNL